METLLWGDGWMHFLPTIPLTPYYPMQGALAELMYTILSQREQLGTQEFPG